MHLDNKIWKAITELFFLLAQPNLPEKEYQSFFERNPCVFDILGFDCYAPFEIESGNKLPFDEERGFTPMPDFICGKRDVDEAVVFELKRPDETRGVTTRADGNRAKLRANIEGYVSQTCEYVKSIRGNSDARKVVCQILGMKRIRSTSGFLMCGIGDVSKACWFLLCSDASVGYAEASEAQGDPPCPVLIRPNSAACSPA